MRSAGATVRRVCLLRRSLRCPSGASDFHRLPLTRISTLLGFMKSSNRFILMDMSSRLPFQIDHLDHVAIRVRDLQRSADWYERVMGLKRYQFEEWGEFPIMLLAGTTGLALFPAHLSDAPMPISKHVKIDHFAFALVRAEFNRARTYFDRIDYTSCARRNLFQKVI